MARVDKVSLRNLNHDFQSFQKKMLQQQSPAPAYVISQLSQYEKKFKKLGLEHGYAGSLYTFANMMSETGHKDIPGIIYSALIKLPFLTPITKEHYILKALEYARSQGDEIHEHARLVDLKILYKKTEQKNKYNEVLVQEEAVLKSICSNFKEAKQNFKTHSRGHSSIVKYKLELAKARVDIAKFTMKQEPQRAAYLLKKAIKTFNSISTAFIYLIFEGNVSHLISRIFTTYVEF